MEILENDGLLHMNENLMQVMGFQDENPQENESYFNGDFWIDSDKVKYDNIELYWNLVGPNNEFAICNFDPTQYPDHVRIIKEWVEVSRTNFIYDYYNNSWEDWENAVSGIAYRGGEGYTYGIHVYKGE